MRDRPVHPAAAVFPMLAEDELRELAEDIKTNGLIYPITIDKDGAIVDGRNREAACRMAGVEPRYETLNGHNPVAYILGANIKRRHLSKGQQAAAALLVWDVTRNLSLREFAEQVSQNRERIRQAAAVLEHARELLGLVMDGAESLDKAYEAARARKDAQSSAEAQMGRLRADAPDLADLVVEERLTLREALEVLARRRADERRRKEAATTGLLSALRLLAPPAGDIAEHADNLLASLDPSLVSGGELIASAAVERAIAFLEVVLVGLDEREGQHGGTQAQSVPS